MILTSDPIIPAHAFDAQRFGLSGTVGGPSPLRISGEFPTIRADARSASSVPEGAVVLTSLNVDEAEAKLIARALEVSHGNRTKAAELLGMSVRTLRNKLNGSKVDAAS